MALGFSNTILTWVRLFNMFEISANRCEILLVDVVPVVNLTPSSLERILAYISLEHEGKPTKEGTPPAYWPSSGDLRVENLSARYSPVCAKVQGFANNRDASTGRMVPLPCPMFLST
jgi:hypothetical protein